LGREKHGSGKKGPKKEEKKKFGVYQGTGLKNKWLNAGNGGVQRLGR